MARWLFGVLACAPAVLPAREAPVIDEVVVSVRKRVERIEDVPQSVTVFDTERVEAHGIRSLEDLAAFTPGFSFKSVGSFEGRTASDLRFRGMDINTSIPWLQLGSIFVDGVYISGGVQEIGFENLQRAEIVRGPQSALFGRSTFGGAINFVTADPGDETAARVSATIAQDDGREIQAWAEGGLVPQRLVARMSVRHTQTGGQYTNPTDGVALGKQETLAVSSTLLATPTDALRAKLVAFVAHDDDGLAPLVLVRNVSANCGPFFSGGRHSFCGNLPAKLTGVDADLRDFLAGLQQTDIGIRMREAGLERRVRRASLDLQLRSTPFTVTSVTGASHQAMGSARDADLIPNLQRLHLWQGLETKDFQQELRIASAGNVHFDWLIGASYYDYDYRADTISPPLAPLQSDRTQITTRGYFGSASWRPADRYELTLEGRYQDERIDQGAALHAAFSGFLPRTTLSYHSSDHATWYASAARGNKPGAFNANVAARPTAEQAILAQEYGIGIPIGEENLWSTEIGAKLRSDERRTYLNTALYYADWTNQQTRRSLADPRIQGGAPFTGFVNAGRSELYGIEIESGWRVTDTWTISATYDHAKAEYREFTSSTHQQVFGTPKARGASLPNNPRQSGTLSNAFDWPLGSQWNAVARLDALYEGARYTDDTNLTRYGKRWRLNGQLSLRRGSLQATLFGRNLGDNRTTPSARLTTDIQQGGFAWEVLLPERRTFGLRLDYAWGAQ